MKDGLDMTALREVKFLQELHHPNIIAVSPHIFWVASIVVDGVAIGCLLGQAEREPGSRILGHRP